MIRSPKHLFFPLCSLCIAALQPPCAAQINVESHLPDVDKRQLVVAAKPTIAQLESAQRLRARAPDVSVELSPLPGRATAVYTRGAGIPKPAFRNSDDGQGIVRDFLDENRDLFGFGSEVLRTARLLDDGAGGPYQVRTVRWQQELDGIPVFQGLLTAILSRQGDLLDLSSLFTPDLERDSRKTSADRMTLYREPPVSPTAAVVLAAADLGDALAVGELVTSIRGQPELVSAVVKFESPALNGGAEARMVWLPIAPDHARLCWDVVLVRTAEGDRFRVLVDAETGEVQLRHCLTSHLQAASYKVYTGESPTPFLPGYATDQNPNQPTNLLTPEPDYVSQTELSNFTVVSANGSPNGWIADGDNRTRGNNVDAYLNPSDLLDPPIPSSSNRPPGSPFRVFYYRSDPTLDPTYVDSLDPMFNNRYAAVVNGFYWANWIHDKLYDLGFTEDPVSGKNFQGIDPVRLSVQTGSDLGYRNGGSMENTADGTSARLRLFIWSAPNGPVPRREGAFDAVTLAHEYTHGLVYRRPGGGQGAGITAQESRILTEGWADFMSLALLAPATGAAEVLDGTYPYAAYSTYRWQGTSDLQDPLTENYYFGLRDFPYSTDMTKNPKTLLDLDKLNRVNQKTAHRFPIPVSPFHRGYLPPDPLLFPDGFDPYSSSNEEHSAGEIWCSALWDVRANLIRELGYSGINGGQTTVLRLVMEGMRSGSPNPTILCSRDSILSKAALEPDATTVTKEVWAGFYKRGLGPQAKVNYDSGDLRFTTVPDFNRADFDLNGKADIFFEALDTTLKAWSMNGTTVSETGFTPSTLGGSWWVVGTADINQDGRVDFFAEDNHFTSATAHYLGYRYYDGTGQINVGALDPLVQGDGKWHIVATGDFHRETQPGVFYRDTQPDLLWRHDDGYIVVWWMDGPNLVSAAFLNPYWIDPLWRIVGTGDFNDDGKTDIVWQFVAPGQSDDGRVHIWIMNGINKVQGINISALGDPRWRAFGTGDYNGDKKTDVLFQFKPTPSSVGGTVGVWYLDGTSYLSAATFTPDPGAYNVVGPR